MRTQRVGLTGGIGSGKSTVAHMLQELGAALVDADAVSRQVTAAGGSAIAAIARHFGDDAIDADGAMNREVMRSLVFSDPAARHQLEAIIHPLVQRATSQLASEAIQAGQWCVVHDIPLLAESGRWRAQLDQVLVVDCLPATQIDRVMQRESARPGWDRTVVERVMAAQASRFQRLSVADICIYNDGVSLGELKHLVRQAAKSFGL